MIINIILLVALLTLSAYFSGSETAFFSLNHIEKEKLLSGAHGKRRAFLGSIMDSPAEVLITILTGNMVVNLFFASTMDEVMSVFVDDHAWLYSIVVGTILVLIFGEMTPKNLAIRHALPFFRLSSRVLRGIHISLTPVRFILKRIERSIMSFLTGRLHPDVEDSKSLISSTVQIGLKKGIVHESELSILESFLDFREKTAADVMIPRTEITAVEARSQIADLLELAERNPDSPLVPVYRETVDHITGYVNLRDLLPHRHQLAMDTSLASIMKPVYPVPESKNLMELLRDITRSNHEMALVVDEYGGTAGIVTYQNLVEDFLYFFYPSKTSHTQVDERTFRFPGSFELERVEELLETDFESESRTVSGFVIEILEDIPSVGDEATVGDVTFTVRAVSRRKILEVEAKRIQV